MIDKILENLKEIEDKHDVKVLYAIESGSRAWGFASPDSDYDVRFIYVHKKTCYLQLNKSRDVIEWVLNDVLDINGWDLKKALLLLHSSNPTLLEWLYSPIIYYESKDIEKMRSLAALFFNERAEAYHYLSMAKRTYEIYIKNKTEVKLKKYFYVFRPLLCVKYIIRNHSMPPVLFNELLDKELPEYLRADLDQFIKLKMDLNETDLIAPRIDFNEYIEKELIELKKQISLLPKTNHGYSELNDYFIKIIDRWNVNHGDKNF